MENEQFLENLSSHYALAIYHGIQVICEILSLVSPEEQEIEGLLDIIRDELKKKKYTGKEVKRNNKKEERETDAQ